MTDRPAPPISSKKLAEDVIRFVFRTQLGRDPGPSEFVFQKPFLLDGILSVEAFNQAIRDLDEARRFRAVSRGVAPDEVHDVGGCSFSIPRGSPLALALRGPGGYEGWALPHFLELCRPGMTVVDVGANWGVYAIPAARRVGASGRVYAFEANPQNAKILLRNAKRNQANVNLLTVALSDNFGLAMLPVDGAQNSGFVIIDKTDVASQALQWEPVTTLPLDSMQDAIGRVDLMKLDIEGAEYRACRGATRIISGDRPVVFLEFAPILLRYISKVEPADLLGMFHDLGYTVDVLHREGPPERMPGERSDMIERVTAQCNDAQTHVDLRFLPQ